MKKYLLLLMVLVNLWGCSNEGGSEYVGTWVRTTSPDYKLEIVKNGSHYLVKEIYPGDGKPRIDSYPAVLKDGMVQVQTAVGAASFTINKQTGHLVGSGKEWRREK